MAGETLKAVTQLSQIGLATNPIPLVAADDANGDYFLNSGSDVVVVVSNPTGGAIDVVITDVKTTKGRQLTTTEKTVSVDPGDVAILGPFNAADFNQRTGDERHGVLLSYSAAGLELAPLRVPRLPR